MFIEAKDDGGGGDNWTRAKLQSNHHDQQTSFLQAECPSWLPSEKKFDDV